MDKSSVPVPLFHSCDLESLTLQWSGEPNVEYKLDFRDAHKQGWDVAYSMRIAPAADGKQTVKVGDLLPSNTYLFRLWVIRPEGLEGPGPDVAFDTEVVSCAPRQRCCAIA